MLCASTADLHRDLLASVAERSAAAAPALVRHVYAKVRDAAPTMHIAAE
jgi:hypothetical protein